MMFLKASWTPLRWIECVLVVLMCQLTSSFWLYVTERLVSQEAQWVEIFNECSQFQVHATD
ncbi:MAG: hypothetical protein ACON5A_00070 [Candidatus Comchoanobacterales bacterium]